MQLPTTTSYLSIYLWVLVVYRAKIKIWNLVWIRNPSVQLCRVYRKPKIRSPPGWIPIKSPNYHSPNACYMFNFKPGIRVVNLERAFVKFRCYLPLLPTLKFWKCCRATVCSIMVEKFKFPAVGYLPWPICRFKKFKTKIAHKIEKIRETAIHLQFSPVGLVIFVSREYFILSCDHHQSTDLNFQDLFLGLRRLAAEEGTFSKKTWVQKIKPGSWWAPCGPDFRVMDRRDPGTNGCLGIQWFGIWNV